ncbi:MAG: hypothetical protein K2P88_02515 [Chitinophagaceae bacterium]|nr:hypothetical protein [Chitinophagaceae bacterium]
MKYKERTGGETGGKEQQLRYGRGIFLSDLFIFLPQRRNDRSGFAALAA